MNYYSILKHLGEYWRLETQDSLVNLDLLAVSSYDGEVLGALTEHELTGAGNLLWVQALRGNGRVGLVHEDEINQPRKEGLLFFSF